MTGKTTLLIAVLLLLIIWILTRFIFKKRSKTKGEIGEEIVSDILSQLGEEYTTYNNVIIANGETTSQIDHVVVSPYGVFVIETKNYSGWIFCDANQKYWTQIIWGYRYRMPNPIHQNFGHIAALRKILPTFTSKQYTSIIAFTPYADFRTPMPDKYNVIYTPHIIDRIKQYEEVVLSDDNISILKGTLENKIINGDDAELLHISNVTQSIYQKENLIQTGFCPQCGGALVKREGPFGYFYGCTNYPSCKFTVSEDEIE